MARMACLCDITPNAIAGGLMAVLNDPEAARTMARRRREAMPRRIPRASSRRKSKRVFPCRYRGGERQQPAKAPFGVDQRAFVRSIDAFHVEQRDAAAGRQRMQSFDARISDDVLWRDYLRGLGREGIAAQLV